LLLSLWTLRAAGMPQAAPSGPFFEPYDDIEAAYEPLSPTSSVHSEMAFENWGSIAFENLLYSDDDLQNIVKSFRAAVIAAIKNKDFGEAHQKAEEQAKFLRDYIRRCMGAEHVCCDSQDYEQAQKISKAIKYAAHLKKVTGERGGIAFGAVRRVQELLVKYRKHIENTKLEMKEAGDARNYTKAIALQHDLETSKNDFALKLCAHVDRILESGNLRALEIACKAIQDQQPELQPDIMNIVDTMEEQDKAVGGNTASDMPTMIAAPPGTARRPHSARSAREAPPERHRFAGDKRLKGDQQKELNDRLAKPKKPWERVQNGEHLLFEEKQNCTFRPLTDGSIFKGVKKPSVNKANGYRTGGVFWPTDRYPRRNPSPHGKARFEGDINLDPGGDLQIQRSIICLKELLKKEGQECDISDTDMEGAMRLVNELSTDETMLDNLGLNEHKATALQALKGQDKVFKFLDLLRAKEFTARSATWVKNAKSEYEGTVLTIQEEQIEQARRIQKVVKIKKDTYSRLTKSSKKAMYDTCPTPKVDLDGLKALVAQQCQFPNDDSLEHNIGELVKDPERSCQVLKCDKKEAKKLMTLQGEALIRMAATLSKRAKFVSRMDSYNYKTRS